jgi:hypothetical protein
MTGNVVIYDAVAVMDFVVWKAEKHVRDVDVVGTMEFLTL